MEKEVIRHIIEDSEISSDESQKQRFFFLLNTKKCQKKKSQVERKLHKSKGKFFIQKKNFPAKSQKKNSQVKREVLNSKQKCST